MKINFSVIISVVVVAIAVICVSACIYNSIFPQKYLKDKYPNAEIVSSNAYNGSIGIMTSSDLGYRYKDYKLYDVSENISFGQDFELVWYFPFYRPVSPMENFEVQLKHKRLVAQTVGEIKTITEKYTNDCIAVANPFDSYLNSGCGCHIFIKKHTAENISALTKELDNYVKSKWYLAENAYYVSYSVFICMDNDIYNKFAETDFSNAYAAYIGHAYFTDMLTAVPEFEATRITISKEGFSKSIYEKPGDPANDEYQDPNSFDHLVFWYDSEPNAIGHQSFYLFGVNERK